MTRFRLTELAEGELEGIVDHITDDAGADRAHAVLSDLVGAFGVLAEQPGIGHARHDLASDELRFWSVHRFLIAYRPETIPLEIVHVMHGSREPAALRRVLDEQAPPSGIGSRPASCDRVKSGQSPNHRRRFGLKSGQSPNHRRRFGLKSGQSPDHRARAIADERLAPIARHGLWRTVGRMRRFPAESTVLQGRRGYRDVLHHFVRLRLATRIPLGATRR